MRKHLALAVAAVAALSGAGLGAVATAEAAGAPAHTSYAMRGTVAEAYWFTEEEPPAGSPWAIAVIGADAMTRQHTRGTRPARAVEPALVAMAISQPGAEPGEDPVPLELWGTASDATFTAGRRLGSASVRFDTTAQYFSIDPETGEEVPTGETVPLSVHATWTATGPAFHDSMHSRYGTGQFWTIDRGASTSRPATAEVTITGPDGVWFDGPMVDAQIYRARFSSMTHGSEEPLRAGRR